MNFSINQLNSLVKLISSNPNEAKALIKLTSVDILKSLGNGQYNILLDGKTLTAQSHKTLTEGSKYWTQLTDTKDSTPKLSNLIKIPQILESFQNRLTHYSIKELLSILESKNPAGTFKQSLVEQLATASTKEEFSNISNLLLSLQNQTFTIPLLFNSSFSILQFKKRYNKKTKKTQIDFYTALEFLGPISGVISFDNGNIVVNINVAFDKTKNFLENDMENFSYKIDISLLKDIEPLYNTNKNSLLDISI